MNVVSIFYFMHCTSEMHIKETQKEPSTMESIFMKVKMDTRTIINCDLTTIVNQALGL